ncbi:uncharacterized protein CBL_02818 [Carabus blaptoides fortunei]
MFAHKICSRFQTSKAIIIYTENSILPKRYMQQLCAIRRTPTIRNFVLTPKRNISFQSLRKPNIEKLKLNDNIPKQYELVYRCTMSSYLYAAQISATIGALFVVIVAIFNYDSTNKFEINLSGIDLHNIMQSEYQLIVFSAAFVLLNIAVMVLVSKFPVRIYFNAEGKKYIGVVHGKIPKTKNILEFNAGDVKHTPKNGVLPWNEYYYKIKNGQTIIMLDHYFRKPDDMNIMLGYTKL